MKRSEINAIIREADAFIRSRGFYLPHNHRAYYDWALVASYRPAQHISVYQFSPAHLRIVLFSRWEFGMILGNWLLGLRLGQPLAWFRRVQTV